MELQAVYCSKKHLYLITELFGAELYARLDRNPAGLVGDDATAVTRGVAAALAHMHARLLVHRDVKPENVLVRGGGGPIAGHGRLALEIKLCDLGLATSLKNPTCESPDCVTRTLEQKIAPREEAPRLLFQCCGSLGFFAPEMLSPDGYDGRATDVWSLGCLALECAVGSEYFSKTWFAVYRDFFRGEPRAPPADDEYPRFKGALAAPVAAVRAAARGSYVDSWPPLLEPLGDAIAARGGRAGGGFRATFETTTPPAA